MKHLIRVLLLISATIIFQCSAQAAQFTPDQVKQLQSIIHDYIVNNPDVLVEASKKLQAEAASKEKEAIKEINANVPKFKKEIFDTTVPGRIVIGNPNGKYTLAVFTQFQCPHCKVVEPLIEKLIQDNKDLKVIVIYWPFFGNHAVYAAKAAAAAQNQGKFAELNKAMFSFEGFLKQDDVDKLATTIPGLDLKKFHDDINSSKLDDGLKNTFALAQDKIKLIGTPTLIFTNQNFSKFSVVPGQTPDVENDIKKSLNEVK